MATVGVNGLSSIYFGTVNVGVRVGSTRHRTTALAPHGGRFMR